MKAQRRRAARRPARSAASPPLALEPEAKPPTALVLSAGAPNALLMAGALCALWENGKTFDVVYTTGGSAFLGLVYAAPAKKKKPNQALRDLVDLLSIPDVIFKLFPLNYRVFVKAGPFTKPIHEFARRFAIESPRTAGQRLYNALVDLGATMITPTTVTPWSRGICEPFPFLSDVVDFDRLDSFHGGFYMNALNITDLEMRLFWKEEIDERHFRAALAYPFMYPPVEIDGKVYFEGADFDPVSFGNLGHEKVAAHKIKTLVLMDVLGSLGHYIIRDPANLWEAYGMSVITPAVSLAAKCIELFEKVGNRDPNGTPIYAIKKINFDIPEDRRPHIMDWSYSNLDELFKIGKKAGEEFLAQNVDILRDIPPDAR